MSIIFIFSSSVATDPILRIRKHDNASDPTDSAPGYNKIQKLNV